MRWSLYDSKTGLFSSRRLNCSEAAARANTPAGMSLLAGHHDPLTHRVDVATGLVVDYQPPPPSPDHELNANPLTGRARWVKRAEVSEMERRDRRARADIERLERQQLRPLRELALDPSNAEARQWLEAIEGEIATARAALQRSAASEQASDRDPGAPASPPLE